MIIMSENEHIKAGAVILAAGYSSRMKAFKPLLPLGDKRVIDRVIETAADAGIRDIVVVTGHNRNAMRPVIAEADLRCGQRGVSVSEAWNPDFAGGMYTSIQAGIRAMEEGVRELTDTGMVMRRPDVDGVFVMPVDCPLADAAAVMQMMTQTDDMKFAVPLYRGKKGHPLWIPRRFFYEIEKHDEPEGLKGITDKYPQDMIRIETGHEGIVLDMDDEDGYREVQAYLERGCVSESLTALAAGRRFFLVRHGQPQQHKEKIFLGQTDVPLSETGRQQAAEAAGELLEAAGNAEKDKTGMSAGSGLDTDVIYTSGLSRAWQTAEIIAEAINGSIGIGGSVGAEDRSSTGTNEDAWRVIRADAFNEMSLGEWDGRYISEIQEKYPQEYERRGRDPYAFKIGSAGENFYDLQYRVVKELIHILKNDSRRNLVIVAHDGVLRVIKNNLEGGDVSEPWTKMKNGQVLVSGCRQTAGEKID